MPTPRTGGQILAQQLASQAVQHVFCVPGESYLPVLDALLDLPIEVTVCRHEGGAAMMAGAHGKLSGRPGICLVTRGPGAANAASGVDVAMQDSTPMIFVRRAGCPRRARPRGLPGNGLSRRFRHDGEMRHRDRRRTSYPGVGVARISCRDVRSAGPGRRRVAGRRAHRNGSRHLLMRRRGA